MILLDTCTFLWLASDHKRLSKRAKNLIVQHASGLFFSAISAFEIALKHTKGRLQLPLAPEDWIEATLDFHGVAEVPVNWRIAAHSVLLPPHHGDPCDRMIVATAALNGFTVLTPDPLIAAYREATVAW